MGITGSCSFRKTGGPRFVNECLKVPHQVILSTTGTKLHQSTRKAISNHQPSLLKAIKKFNTGCETMEQLRPQCNIPITSPLSTQLNGLRNDPSLHEDVWISPLAGLVPQWLNDADVCNGIHSLHVADRCGEGVVWLNLERENLRHWLLEEREVVKRAIESEPSVSTHLTFLPTYLLVDSPLVFLL
ncbi:hypothetical protein DFH08DRAFT_700907 [Mycena albidolilacea]|uniref:Uncharacterized protein n=1 Tax=Mycena albidolilacea TaxID=1033008 RepID=A0AAD7A1P9_9AGAR|nr:hypothetical protein DFH08DRAFT_700907 [Mycena albidolilacea]